MGWLYPPQPGLHGLQHPQRHPPFNPAAIVRAKAALDKLDVAEGLAELEWPETEVRAIAHLLCSKIGRAHV